MILNASPAKTKIVENKTPKIAKTQLKPKMKKIAVLIKRKCLFENRNPCPFLPLSRKEESPALKKTKKDVKTGKTQGEKKERSPAPKDIAIVKLFMF